MKALHLMKTELKNEYYELKENIITLTRSLQDTKEVYNLTKLLKIIKPDVLDLSNADIALDDLLILSNSLKTIKQINLSNNRAILSLKKKLNLGLK